MKVLWISDKGKGIGIAHRMVRQNDDVRFLTLSPSIGDSGKGLVEIVESWRPSLGWADLIVFDGHELSHMQDRFEDLTDAHLFGISYIGSIMTKDKAKQEELITKIAPDGVSMGKYVEWTSPRVYHGVVDDLGPFDRGMGPQSVIGGTTLLPIKHSPLKPFMPFFYSIGYNGPVTLENGSIRTGLEYPYMDAVCELMKGKISDFMTGKDTRIKVYVSLCATLFLMGDPERDKGKLIRHLDVNTEHCSLTNCYVNGTLETGGYHWAASDSEVVRVTASARTIPGARSLLRKRLKSFEADGLIYRLDVGASALQELVDETWQTQ